MAGADRIDRLAEALLARDDMAFCLGADVARVVGSTFPPRPAVAAAEGVLPAAGGAGVSPAQRQLRDAYDLVCGAAGAELLDRHVCSGAELDFYASYFTYGDAERLPANAWCPAEASPMACGDGFFALRLGAREAAGLADGAPARCCEGFYCPGNLSCMLRCPAGASCPLATPSALFSSRSLQTRYEEGAAAAAYCAPYGYEATRWAGEAVCGGAHAWPREPRTLRWSIASLSSPAPALDGRPHFGASVRALLDGKDDEGCLARLASQGSIYCPPGFYCPDGVSARPCPRHHRCDAGATRPERCGALDICARRCGDAGTTHAITGAVLLGIAALAVALAFAVTVRRRFVLGRGGRAGPWLFRRLSRASPRLEAPDLEDAGMDVATEMVFLGGDEEECASPRAAAPAAPPDEADDEEEDDAPAVESNVEQRRVRPISIGFSGLSVYVRPSMKPILSGVTGRFRSGAYESHHAAGAPRARFV